MTNTIPKGEVGGNPEVKVVIWEGFTNSWEKKKEKRKRKEREAKDKDKGERESYTQLNAEFQKIARENEKAFLNE